MMRTGSVRLSSWGWCARAALCLVLGLAGCGKQNLDQSADALIAALQSGEYSRFTALSHEALQKVVPAEKFAEFVAVVKQLGPFQGRSMTGIEAKSGGVRAATYSLSFGRGKVELELKLLEGKLTAFNLTGEPVNQALRTIQAEKYATFKVASFQFQDQKEKPKNNIYQPRATIHFAVVVHGITIVDDKPHLKADLRVLSTAGEQLATYPAFLDTDLAAAGGARVATVTGRCPAPAQPGAYKLELTITDGFGKRSTQYTEALIVE